LFIQADNGQIDSNNVIAWLRKNGIYTRYKHPYHPNMNGFVERAFRSIKDLARCMLHHAGLPEPYWEKAIAHACLIRNIMPNATINGFVREAYNLWYGGAVYNYSRLRTWGSRAYALNHIKYKDFKAKSVPGIFVGMIQNDLQYQYEIYLPSKNEFITSGDVIFCEHVGRAEPERLLPPISLIPDNFESLDVNDYQYLVDTIHMDNEEGILYKVTKVYAHKGLAVADRVIYNDNDNSGKSEMIHLKDILRMPIVQGYTNRKYQETAAMISDSPWSNGNTNTLLQKEPTPIEPDSLNRKETLQQKAKRLRGEAQAVAQEKNIKQNLRRSKRNKVDVNNTKTVVDYNIMVAKLILDWAVDYIPDNCWEPVEHPIDNESIEINSSNIEINHSNIKYKHEPRHHAEAMSRHSEKLEWIAS